MRFVRWLIVCILISAFGFFSNSVFSEEVISQRVILFGIMFQMENGEYFISPEFISKLPTILSDVSESTVGLRVELPENSSIPENGKKCLVVGSWDFELGCVEAEVVQEDTTWMSGELKDGKFYLVGKEYFLVYANELKMENKPEGMVELFGSRVENTVVAYAICPALKTQTTITGLIKAKHGNRVTITKIVGSGRDARVEDIELILNDDTPIFEGRNRISINQIIPGRIGICRGNYHYSTRQMKPEILICNSFQATEGGRITGVITGNKNSNLKVRASINQLVHTDFDVALRWDGWVVMNGRILPPDEFEKIPLNHTVEIIGVFGEENKKIVADIIRVDPFSPSTHVFGIWDEKSETVTDFFGINHKVEILETTWISAPGGTLKDGRFIHVWLDKNQAVSCFVPELGIMGVRITGWLKSVNDGVIQLDCLGSMDYGLQGKIIPVLCGESCSVIEGGVGFVDVDTIPAGTLLHCWGIPDFEGNFKAMMVSVR